ncbi:MAG TPA: polysaccharide biosynthesis/export family protein [Candidatus Binatia bacterium]|nr:polysaccharide biosynthesis/export family protein [Candidatus Binatia bacterium]
MVYLLQRSFGPIIGLLLLSACTPAMYDTFVPSDRPLSTKQGVSESRTETPTFAPSQQEANDAARLTALWEKRTQGNSSGDYPIGIGDLLEISVTGMEEFRSRIVRVSADGKISLPFVGALQAAGVTEKTLRENIRVQLEARYMHDPQVDLFVKEYRNRQVAVIGAVKNPGLYSLVRGTDNLIDVISQAGGMLDGAAQRIHFIPAEPVASDQASQILANLPSQVTSVDSLPLILKSVDPIVIDLKTLTKGSNRNSLAIPMRPGDVIMIPGASEVLVDGWVAKPGSYKLAPGLTVLGVVSAAGGTLFEADTTAVKIMRSGRGNEKIFLLADLDGIKRGDKPDIPVQEGDVVEVSYSPTKLAAGGIYRFFSTVFRVGASVRVPMGN